MRVDFGSVCSGIEAASVAFTPLGWEAAWFSEIEPFPCSVLAHHYPSVPNQGDMTSLPALIRAGLVCAPAVFCGGTPCQAFSVAGSRRSLSDARGCLTLVFCDIADAIDESRLENGQEECVIFWENVPGVLNTEDNAFGCFLAQLAGEEEPLVPSGKKWTHAGAVFGPKRAVAWRVLDAQYFGLAQRRRRVFVVASAREGFDPVAVLFEREDVRLDSPPRREAREGTAAGAEAGAGSHGGPAAFLSELAACLTTGTGQRYDPETETLIPTIGGGFDDVAHTLRGEGFDASEDGTGRGTPLVPVVAGTLKANNGGGGFGSDPSETFVPVAFHAEARADQLPGPDKDTSVSDALTCSQHAAAAVALRGCDGGATAELGDEVSHALRASSGGGDKPHVMTGMAVRRLTPRECERLQGFPDDYTRIPSQKGWRDLDACETPEGLMAEGFEVKQNKKTGRWRVRDADGPRYKAVGNSWAVPCVAWIGERIHQQLAFCEALK